MVADVSEFRHRLLMQRPASPFVISKAVRGTWLGAGTHPRVGQIADDWRLAATERELSAWRRSASSARCHETRCCRLMSVAPAAGSGCLAAYEVVRAAWLTHAASAGAQRREKRTDSSIMCTSSSHGKTDSPSKSRPTKPR